MTKSLPAKSECVLRVENNRELLKSFKERAMSSASKTTLVPTSEWVRGVPSLAAERPVRVYFSNSGKR